MIRNRKSVKVFIPTSFHSAAQSWEKLGTSPRQSPLWNWTAWRNTPTTASRCWPSPERGTESAVNRFTPAPKKTVERFAFGKHTSEMSEKSPKRTIWFPVCDSVPSCVVSSWTSSRGEGGRCLQLCGVRVLASSFQSQRHHQEIYGFLLQPPPHGKQQTPFTSENDRRLTQHKLEKKIPVTKLFY